MEPIYCPLCAADIELAEQLCDDCGACSACSPPPIAPLGDVCEACLELRTCEACGDAACGGDCHEPQTVDAPTDRITALLVHLFMRQRSREVGRG